MLKLLTLALMFTGANAAAMAGVTISHVLPDVPVGTLTTDQAYKVYIKTDTVDSATQSLVLVFSSDIDVSAVEFANIGIKKATKASDCSASSVSYGTIGTGAGELIAPVSNDWAKSSATLKLQQVAAGNTKLGDMCYELTISKNVKLKGSSCKKDVVTATGMPDEDATTGTALTAPVKTAANTTKPCAFCSDVKGGTIAASTNCQCGASTMTTGILCYSTSTKKQKCGKSTGTLGTAAADDVYTCTEVKASSSNPILVGLYSVGMLALIRKVMS